MDEQDVKEFIEHHGVVGMHWGVRRGSSARRQSTDSKRVSELRKRPKHQLTNKQLRTVNERMKLEQNFSRMNPGSVKKGAETAAAMLATIGVGFTAYNMIKSPGGQALVSIGKKMLNKYKKAPNPFKVGHSDTEVGVDFIKQHNSLLLQSIS